MQMNIFQLMILLGYLRNSVSHIWIWFIIKERMQRNLGFTLAVEEIIMWCF